MVKGKKRRKKNELTFQCAVDLLDTVAVHIQDITAEFDELKESFLQLKQSMNQIEGLKREIEKALKKVNWDVEIF